MSPLDSEHSEEELDPSSEEGGQGGAALPTLPGAVPPAGPNVSGVRERYRPAAAEEESDEEPPSAAGEPPSSPEEPHVPAPVHPAAAARPRPADRPEPRSEPFAQSGSVPTDPRFADLDSPLPRSKRLAKPAPVFLRLLAHAVDRLVVLPLVGLLFLVSEALWARTGGAFFVPVDALVVAWFVGGWVLSLLGDALAGRSPGRRLVGVRLATSHGRPPSAFRVLGHRFTLDVLLLLVAFGALWLTIRRQGLNLSDPTRDFGFPDVVIWAVFAGNLLLLLVLFRQLDAARRFLHDRLWSLTVVVGGAWPAPRPAAHMVAAKPALRRRLRWKEPPPKVPSFALDDEEDVPEPVREPLPKPRVMAVRPDPDLDLPGGHDHPRDRVSRLADRMVDLVGYRDSSTPGDVPAPPGVVLRLLLVPTRLALVVAGLLGLRPPDE